MKTAELKPGDRVIFHVGRVLTPGVVRSVAGESVTVARADGREFVRPAAALLPAAKEHA